MYACLLHLARVQKIPFCDTASLRFLGKNTSKHSTSFSQPSSLCKRFISGNRVLGFSGRMKANTLCLPPCPDPAGAKVTIFCYNVSQVSLAGHQQTLHACLPALSTVQKLLFSAIQCLWYLWQTPANCACLPPCLVPGAKVTIFCYTVSQFSLAGHQRIVHAHLSALSPV